MLYFVEEAELHLNCRRVPGTLFTRDIRRTSIGTMRNLATQMTAKVRIDYQFVSEMYSRSSALVKATVEVARMGDGPRGDAARPRAGPLRSRS